MLNKFQTMTSLTHLTANALQLSGRICVCTSDFCNDKDPLLTTAASVDVTKILKSSATSMFSLIGIFAAVGQIWYLA
jgi:hypothetical protein